MPSARSFRLPTLLLAAWCAAPAFALEGTFEGTLIPVARDAPIPIVVQIKEVGDFVTGRVKVTGTLNANVPIEAGRNTAGTCDLRAAINRTTTLRLTGTCNSLTFEGNYTIFYTEFKTTSRGSFRLAHRTGGIEPEKSGASASVPTDSTTSTSATLACTKANTRCLAACPSGNADAEYLCANRCRSKLLACRGKASKDADAAE